MEFFLVLSQLLYLMCYNLYFGTQLDQLMCKTYEFSECGHKKTWACIVNIILLPVLFQRRMSSIGYFSIAALIFTVMSFLLISYECIKIISLQEGGIYEQGQPSNVTSNSNSTEASVTGHNYIYWNL